MDEDAQLTSSPSILIPDSPEQIENNQPEDNYSPEVYPLANNQIPLYYMANNHNYNSEAVLETNSDSPPMQILVSQGFHLSRVSLSSGEVESLQPNTSQPQILNEDSNISTANEESNSASCVDREDDNVLEPPAKLRKISPSKQEEGYGETCPICLDIWGNSGEHRLVALKCGHLFGLQCVEKWLKAQAVKDRSCPTCKSKATLKDIRFIYARRLVAADTSHITELQEQIDVLKSENSRAQLELLESKLAYRACALKLELIESKFMKSQALNQPKRSWRFALEKNQQICKDGGCRVLTYNCRTYELYVSQKSTHSLFPGYGIRKVSCVDYKLGQFVHLHPKLIRDITYSQPKDLLLSVGLDSSARIVERGIPSASVQCGVPLWSCSWDCLRSNEFYVGGVGGVIHQYDVRNTSTSIQILNTNDLSPVVSVRSTEHGLLSCQLNSCWLWESNMNQWAPKAIPVEGPFMSLCYDNESHRALISSRASGNSRSKLGVCRLKSNNSGEVMFEVEQSFVGSARSTLMSRGTFVSMPGSTWAASHSESDSALQLHGLDGARTINLPAVEPALDICTAQLNGDTILAALSESRLRLYKAVATES